MATPPQTQTDPPEPAAVDPAIAGTPPLDPEKTLAVLRVIWALLLVGQLLLAAIGYMFMRSAVKLFIDEDTAWKLFGVNSALLVVNILLGTFLRNQIYKRNWSQNLVKPGGYFMGNVLMFAMIESVVIFAIVVSMLRLSFWPWILPGVLALMVYAVNFPHGGPMFPHKPQEAA